MRDKTRDFKNNKMTLLLLNGLLRCFQTPFICSVFLLYCCLGRCGWLEWIAMSINGVKNLIETRVSELDKWKLRQIIAAAAATIWRISRKSQMKIKFLLKHIVSTWAHGRRYDSQKKSTIYFSQTSTVYGVFLCSEILRIISCNPTIQIWFINSEKI